MIFTNKKSFHVILKTLIIGTNTYKLRIKNIHVFSAPLDGYADSPFRQLSVSV